MEQAEGEVVVAGREGDADAVGEALELAVGHSKNRAISFEHGATGGRKASGRAIREGQDGFEARTFGPAFASQGNLDGMHDKTSGHRRIQFIGTIRASVVGLRGAIEDDGHVECPIKKAGVACL